MATISSIGVGSGLDAESIITKLVALEKQPLTTLQSKATFFQSQISEFGKVQSEVSALADAASALSSAAGWDSRTASISNSSAASVSVTSSAGATSFTLDVDALAASQSVASVTQPPTDFVGGGSMTLQLGSWAAGGASFTPATGSSPKTITIGATDKMSVLAQKINAEDMGIVATVFNDGTNERLLLRSKNTGEVAGFRVQVTDDDGLTGDGAGLSRFAFDPAAGAFGMASGATPIVYGSDAKARINGMAVTSASNTFSENIPGVTIKLLSTTTSNYGLPAETRSPATVTVSEDVTLAVKNVSAFVDAYNKLASHLTNLTKYDAATKTGSAFQGDSSIVGIQSVLRSIVGSTSVGSSAYQYLSDVGLQMQRDGTLSINTAKLAAAANNGTELKKLFLTNNSSTLTNGFALKVRDFAQGALFAGGVVSNKAKALQTVLNNNSKDQDRVNARATQVETKLRRQYSALDKQMASLTALSSYVSQQVTTWNKSSG